MKKERENYIPQIRVGIWFRIFGGLFVKNSVFMTDIKKKKLVQLKLRTINMIRIIFRLIFTFYTTRICLAYAQSFCRRAWFNPTTYYVTFSRRLLKFGSWVCSVHTQYMYMIFYNYVMYVWNIPYYTKSHESLSEIVLYPCIFRRTLMFSLTGVRVSRDYTKKSMHWMYHIWLFYCPLATWYDFDIAITICD